VMAPRLLGLRALPAPVYNNIAPPTTTCEEGSAILLPSASSQDTGSFRDVGDTGLAKEKHELLSLFASGRDTGFILDVTEGDIASPTGVVLTRLHLRAPGAKTTQCHLAAPVPVSTYRGSSKHLKRLEAAERVQRDENRSLEALSGKARRAETACLEKDKRDLLLLFTSRRDAGFILDVTGSSPAPCV